MEVLVGGDAGHDSTAGKIGEEPARVVVRDSCRELLQRDVHEQVGQGRRLGTTPVETWIIRARSSATGSTATRHGEVVPNHDRVAPLLGGPAPSPCPPCMVIAEEAGECPEVVREVVLGQEVHEQRAAGRLADVGVVRLPGLVGAEIPPAAPRHELVREPFPRRAQVPLEKVGDPGCQLSRERLLVHRSPTYRLVGR